MNNIFKVLKNLECRGLAIVITTTTVQDADKVGWD